MSTTTSFHRISLSRRGYLATMASAAAALGLAACSDPGTGSSSGAAPASWSGATDKLDGIALLGVLGAIAARDPQASNVIVHDHILRLAPAKD